MTQEMTSEKKEILEALRKCKLFSELPDELLCSVAELGSIKEYGAGEDIYVRGSLGDKLYILSQGEVALYRRVDLIDKRPAMATVYVAKESPHRRLLGGWCTLVGEEHVQMCTARCVRPSKVVSIGCTALRETLAKSPALHVNILEKLVLILRDRIESSYGAMETL